MGNTFGNTLHLTIFGESHGTAIGCVIDGLPAGIAIDWDKVSFEMRRRAPGSSPLATPRKEKDEFEILSGYFDGHTEGDSLAMQIRNGDQHSKDYSRLKDAMRPGHADYTGHVKYDGYNDYRGGGHFSGRITAPLTFAGAIAKQILAKEGIVIGAHALSVAGIMDFPFDPLGEEPDLFEKLSSMRLPVIDGGQGAAMKEAILAAQKEGDSVGGQIECMALGLPVGMGEPFFDSLESEMGHMAFSIPAVKSISFGDGETLAGMRGSEANDPMRYENGKVKTITNHNGGVLGGISNGNPLRFTVTIKPTASIGKRQETVDISKKEDTMLSIGGRHDPCIVTRAIPVVENAAAFVLLDLLLTGRRYHYGR